MQVDPVLYKMGNQDNNKVFSNANKHVEKACSIWWTRLHLQKSEIRIGGSSEWTGGKDEWWHLLMCPYTKRCGTPTDHGCLLLILFFCLLAHFCIVWRYPCVCVYAKEEWNLKRGKGWNTKKQRHTHTHMMVMRINWILYPSKLLGKRIELSLNDQKTRARIYLRTRQPIWHVVFQRRSIWCNRWWTVLP